MGEKMRKKKNEEKEKQCDQAAVSVCAIIVTEDS